MDPAKYEYQSEFARRHLAKGKAEGKAEGKADLLLKLLAVRFGPLAAEVVARVRAAPVAELDIFAERVLTAASLEAVLGAV